MARITVDEETVLQTLRDVVAERPEYVYEAPEHMRVMTTPASCFYVHTAEDDADTCGCVVGHVLNRLGVPLEEMKRYEGSSAYDMVDELINTSESAILAMDAAQRYQDSGTPWGETLRRVEAGD
ncbi:hypothetical protein ACFVZM_06610 [Streptomyces sioyaensis]|uniref:hypothetical protein n=1 Tax=Streptomyces sioyaensis TaxID=67364 RepID=UPI0036A61227